jgi:ATP-dependent DNA ligase
MNPTIEEIAPLTYPPRPVNGGPWSVARKYPKPGVWRYEPKYNGWRGLVHVPSGTMFNRHGQQLSITAEFKGALSVLRTLDIADWLDCEALERRHKLCQGCLIVLDVPVPILTYVQRRELLNRVHQLNGFEHIQEPNQVFRPPSFAVEEADAVWDKLQNRNRSILGCEFYEGLVAKRADSTYPLQLRSPDAEFPGWVKHRWAF